MIRTIGAVHAAMRKKHRNAEDLKQIEVAIKKRRRAPAHETMPPPRENKAHGDMRE